jgi:hypothetical protein
MKTTRTIILSLVLGALTLAPAAAIAKHGADDDPAVADDRGGLRDDGSRGGDDKGGRSEDGSRGGGSKGGSRDKRVAGRCTGSSTAKIKAKPDDGRLEVEFEVDQNRNGVPWRVTIRRNGNVAVRTTATTRAPSGSFSVERRIANGRGSDRISARATSPSGEVCTARVSI